MATTLASDVWKKAQFDSAVYAAVDFDTDAIYMLLVTATGAAVADATKQAYDYEGATLNANEVAGSGGYTTRGQTVGTVTVTTVSHTTKITSAAVTWGSATITSSGCWLIKHLGTAAASPAIAYLDFGGSFVSTSGNFTVTPNASGLIVVS